MSLWGLRGSRSHWGRSCSRGLIVLSSNSSYYLRPLGSPEPGLHLIQRAEHLPVPGGTCGHGHDLGSTIASIAQLSQAQQPRVNLLGEIVMGNPLGESLTGKSTRVNPLGICAGTGRGREGLSAPLTAPVFPEQGRAVQAGGWQGLCGCLACLECGQQTPRRGPMGWVLVLCPALWDMTGGHLEPPKCSLSPCAPVSPLSCPSWAALRGLEGAQSQGLPLFAEPCVCCRPGEMLGGP